MYQLAFLASAIVKRDGAGKKPKRMIFAIEGLKTSRWDDPRVEQASKPHVLEGGPMLDSTSTDHIFYID